MNDRALVYDSLGALLDYPRAEFHDQLSVCLQRLTSIGSQAAPHAKRFADGVIEMSIIDLEELFTRTFDINPVCALEVGWQLYQENYERGMFIVRMRRLMKQFELPESKELPDHLTHVMQAAGRLNDDELAGFASGYALPAVEKMLKGFGETDNPYKHALTAIQSELNSRRFQPSEGVENG